MDTLIQQLVNGIALGSVYALYALGFSLVLANLKAFNLAHAGVFTWGAIFAWRLVETGVSFWIVLPVTAVLAGALNVVCYFTLVAHLERRPNKELAIFVSTLGGMIVLSELALITLNRQTVRMPAEAFPMVTWDFGIFQLNSIQALILAISLALFLLLTWILGRTELGREIRTAAFDQEVARLLGINARWISVIVFFISGAIGGLGAVFIATAFNIVDAHLGDYYLLTAIAVMVIGGFGSMKGVFVGGILVGITSAFTTAYISSSYRDVVIFGLLLLFLAFRPSGLFRGSDVVERV